MSLPLILPAIPPAAHTIGSLVAGFGASSLVYGMLCLQVWIYYTRYPNDGPGYKSLVFSLFVLETVHQAFIGHTTWFYTVANLGQPQVFFERPVWTLTSQVALGAFIGAIVRICFGMRVWKFSNRNYLVTGAIISMSLAELGLAVASTFESSRLTLDQAVLVKTIATASLALGAGTDIVTALALTYFLQKMRTGYATSDTLIRRLIIYSINTGALTSVTSVAVVINYNLMPNNFIFMALYFVLCKLYANSCLATLNTRRFVQGRGTDNQANTGPSFLMVPRSENKYTQYSRPYYTRTGASVDAGHAQHVSVASEDDYAAKLRDIMHASTDDGRSPATPMSLMPSLAHGAPRSDWI